MSFTIVYKTYLSDIEWLRYSLLSLKKFLDKSHITEILIYSHDECLVQLASMLAEINLKAFINYRIIPVHYDYHGYIKQMVVKCDCFRDVSSSYVILFDSDCIINKPFSVNEYIGLPLEWRYLKKEDDPTCVVWSVWKEAFEAATLHPQNVHYMANGFPFIFTTKSLAEAHDYFIKLHGCDYDAWCQKRMNRIDISKKVTDVFATVSKVFEEFEFLGHYCHLFSKDYRFVTTKESSTKKNTVNQYWSHGTITPAIRTEIEQLLNR